MIQWFFSIFFIEAFELKVSSKPNSFSPSSFIHIECALERIDAYLSFVHTKNDFNEDIYVLFLLFLSWIRWIMCLPVWMKVCLNVTSLISSDMTVDYRKTGQHTHAEPNRNGWKMFLIVPLEMNWAYLYYIIHALGRKLWWRFFCFNFSAIFRQISVQQNIECSKYFTSGHRMT